MSESLRSLRIVVAWWLGLLCCAAQAESCWDKVRAQLETPTGMSAADAAQLDEAAKKCLAEVLSDPATLNRALARLTAVDSGWALLRDIQFSFKTFEAPDATGATRAHLGFSYDYAKSIATAPFKASCGEACLEALDLRFNMQGNVAFESDVNPRDFMEAHLNFAWFRSSGGAKRLSPAAQDAYNALALKMATVPAGREAELEQYTKQLSQLIAGHLTDQWYLEAGADVAFESDQAFERKQTVYAARAAVDFRGWSGLHARSWAATPPSGRLNIFDYPFAFLRRLTGYASCDALDGSLGGCFAPLATSWPTVSLAVGQVRPAGDNPRRALPEGDGDYMRAVLEVSFKTPVAKMKQEPIYVTANYRRYRELDAPLPIEQANLDEFEFFQAVLGPQRGFFASYSRGRLPFDRREDQVYELGFRTALN